MSAANGQLPACELCRAAATTNCNRLMMCARTIMRFVLYVLLSLWAFNYSRSVHPTIGVT